MNFKEAIDPVQKHEINQATSWRGAVIALLPLEERGKAMKKKVEAAIKANTTSVKKVSTGQAIEEKIDETYLQVNKASFQQNLKALIGHFKTRDASVAL